MERWIQIQHDVLIPLAKGGDRGALLEAAERTLSEDDDHEFHQIVFSGVSSILLVHGWRDDSLKWCRRGIEEAPDDPIAQNTLATWYVYNPRRDPTGEELERALEESAIAVEKARAASKWLRHVLCDRCRIATAAERFDIVAEAMEEILDLWETPLELDSPTFEWEWLPKLPQGAVDPDLLARYQAVVDRVLQARSER